MDDSVIIVSYFCHKCLKETDELSANGQTCPRCQCGAVEEITASNGGQGSGETPALDVGPEGADKSATLCSICLDVLATDNNSSTDQDLHRKLTCGHRFHANCITEWLTTQITCPLCRRYVGSTGADHRLSAGQHYDRILHALVFAQRVAGGSGRQYRRTPHL